MSNSIVCFGGAILDNLYKFKDKNVAMGNGNLAELSTVVGGVAFNMAKLLKKSGNKVSLLSIIGDDVAGVRVLTEVKNKGIDTSLIITAPGFSTGSYGALFNQDGDLVLAGVAKDIYRSIEIEMLETHLDKLRKAKAWVIESTFQPEVMQFLADTENKPAVYATICSVDEAKNIYPLLPVAEAVFGHIDEISTLAKIFDPCITTSLEGPLSEEEIWRAVNTVALQGAVKVFCTHDARGIFAVDANQLYRYTAPPVKVVCANGAGDAFAAAAINSLINKQDMHYAISAGLKAAALQLQGLTEEMHVPNTHKAKL